MDEIVGVAIEVSPMRGIEPGVEGEGADDLGYAEEGFEEGGNDNFGVPS